MKILIFITTLFLLIGCGYNAAGPEMEENDSLNIIDTVVVDTVVDNDTTNFYVFRLFIAPLDGSSGQYPINVILTDSVTNIVTIEKTLPYFGKIRNYRVPKGQRVQLEIEGIANNLPILGTWKGHKKLAPFYNVRVGDRHVSFVEE